MRVDQFQFHLPPERIAQRPVEPRDASRLLVVDPIDGSLADAHCYDLPEYLTPGSLLVVNDTRVFPARLIGKKAETGGKVELLLVRCLGHEQAQGPRGPVAAERWRAMGKASKAFRFPCVVLVGEPVALWAIVDKRSDDDGLLEVLLLSPEGQSVREGIEQAGHVPLPPYIRRDDDASDVASYQTVYARHTGAVAAPTAGLHLTHRLIGALSARGIDMATVTLHVGPGTFQPVTAEDFDQHNMHQEWFEVPAFTARQIEEARARHAPVVAVGTTSVRALESAADPERPGCVLPGTGNTRLLIQPGYQFRVVDALLTNFHLPKSTLLALVAAMAGTEQILRAYQHAIEAEYRFFSYGDAMLIRRRAQDRS